MGVCDVVEVNYNWFEIIVFENFDSDCIFLSFNVKMNNILDI